MEKGIPQKPRKFVYLENFYAYDTLISNKHSFILYHVYRDPNIYYYVSTIFARTMSK